MTIFLALVLWMAAAAVPAPCPAMSGAPAAGVCKCGVPSVEGAFDESRTVFSGVVLEVRSIPGPTRPEPARMDSAGNIVVSGGGGLWDQAVTLRVARGWKGAQAGDTVNVRDVIVCGVGFRTGEEYLVYGYMSEDGVLFTTPCQRTRVITPADGTHDVRLPPTWQEVAVLDSLVRVRRP